jgi:S-adenosylmethionine/arginine decarboxylase-like enzyme
MKLNENEKSIDVTSVNEKNYQGNHVLCDLVWNVEVEFLQDSDIFADTVFQIMEDAVKTTGMTIVHKNLSKLGATSPAGFTSCILLLDESHVSCQIQLTAHNYFMTGLIALDAFTCGPTNPEVLMNYIVEKLQSLYPTIRCTYQKNHHRFHKN